MTRRTLIEPLSSTNPRSHVRWLYHDNRSGHRPFRTPVFERHDYNGTATDLNDMSTLPYFQEVRKGLGIATYNPIASANFRLWYLGSPKYEYSVRDIFVCIASPYSIMLPTPACTSCA